MRIFLVFIFLSATLSAQANKEIVRYWHITSSSSLQINGTTNVNSFRCGSFYEKGSDMIRESWSPDIGKWEIYGSVYVEVGQFDCNNRVMNNDFRNTLKYKEYPEIKIEFLNLREVHLENNTLKAQGRIKVTLAGKSHEYSLSSELEFLDDQYGILSGEQTFLFSDFGLEPPQKGFGLVRVNDAIHVSFDLILEKSALAGN